MKGAGERGGGLATVEAVGGDVVRMTVNVEGRTVNVEAGGKGGGGGVYEAEFVEKRR